MERSQAKLEDIDEENPVCWLTTTVQQPETPTETMEFLARSWSISSVELSKALYEICPPPPPPVDLNRSVTIADNNQINLKTKPNPKLTLEKPAAASEPFGSSPPISPRDYFMRNSPRGNKPLVSWLKDQKERKRAEARSRNAQLYAATSVAGVAAVVAAVAAGNVFSPEPRASTKAGAAVASAAALVASHCVEMAQTLGASREQIVNVIRSAVNVQTTGDIMALTAGAATALRGAATLQARLGKDVQGDALIDNNKESVESSPTLDFVHNGGYLLKRTRKGVLHWKQVMVYPNSIWQVVVKMKSTHMAGTFVKNKKDVVIDVVDEVQAWPGRRAQDGCDRKAYFGIKTPERLIEFECKNEDEKLIWVEGIRRMLSSNVIKE